MSTSRISSVVAACGVAACSPQSGDANSAVSPAERGAQEVVEVATITPPKADTGAVLGDASDVEPPDRERATQGLADLRALFALPAWAVLRRVWRELDALGPAADGPGPAPPRAGMDERMADAELAIAQLADSPAGQRLDPALLRLLASVVATRASVLNGLETRLMVMHRMPMPGELAVAHVGGALEQRIDALMAVRGQAGATSPEYVAALGAVRERVLLLGALQAARPGAPFEPIPRVETLADMERALAEQRRTAAADGGTDVLADLERAVADARRLAPLVAAMVADLAQ